ncbi:MAG: hypothetical protein ACFB2W_01520 [Leptolyngbyaceae cyanobacterium]
MKQRLWHALVITLGLYLLFLSQALYQDAGLRQAKPGNQFQKIFSRLLL